MFLHKGPERTMKYAQDELAYLDGYHGYQFPALDRHCIDKYLKVRLKQAILHIPPSFAVPRGPAVGLGGAGEIENVLYVDYALAFVLMSHVAGKALRSRSWRRRFVAGFISAHAGVGLVLG
jgi:hypothetical protein